MSKKTNIANKSIINRMSDFEYIDYLECQIKAIDERVENFIQKMDEAAFSKGAISVFEAYVDNVKLLRL